MNGWTVRKLHWDFVFWLIWRDLIRKHLELNMMNREHACYIFFLLYVTLLERMEAAVHCSSNLYRQLRLHCLHFLILNMIPWSRSNGRCTSGLKIQTQLITLHTLSLTNHSAALTTPPDPDSHSLPDRWCFCPTNDAVCPPRDGAEREGKPLIRQDWDVCLWSSEASNPQSLIPVPWVRSGVSASLLQIPLWVRMRFTLFWCSRVALSIFFDKFSYSIRLYFLALLSKQLTTFICLFLSINKRVCPPAFFLGLINNNYLWKKMQNNNKDLSLN